MRRVRIDDPAVDGALLVRDLCGPTGEVLARAGMRLTARSARSLAGYGVGVCFVEDDASLGITLRPVVDLQGSDSGLLRALKEACAVVWKFAEGPSRQPTTRAVEALKDLHIVSALDTSGATDALRTAAQGLVSRAVEVSGESGFLTERQASDDIYGHSVNVAALVVRLGADVGFQEQDLYSAAMAAIAHDIGLLMVSEEIRRTPEAQRTPAQQRRYEDHTVLGEAILRPFDKRQPALPIVAIEHHEEQGGGGYPHALVGGNRVLRSAAVPGQPKRIALISELVAVADRYEGLISPAPGLPALSPAAARRILSAEAGSKLNAEVVGRFLDLLPQWPVGTEVVLHGGEYEGHRALVTAVDPNAAEKPHVRVFADRRGERITSIDLRLSAEPRLTVTAIDEAA